MAEQQNYGENICQAITIVAEELLKSVTFDKTVIGIIADDTEKENGKYRVSYNTTIFGYKYSFHISFLFLVPGWCSHPGYC